MAIEIEFTARYLKQACGLQKDQRKKLAELLIFLSRDPFHPILHSKKLSGSLSGYYSFRINRDNRVIFSYKNRKKIVLVRVKHRKDVYR